MRSHRLTLTAALLVLAVSAVAPAAAGAGPLLSGYGGPGQGNQAILGSALVNGEGGSSGGGSAGAAGSSAAGSGAGAGGAGAGASTVTRSSSAAGAPGGAPAAAHRRGKQANRPLAGTFSSATAASAQSSSLSASRGRAGGAQTLGLSGADLLYMLLAFGALAFTGLLTAKLAHEPRAGGSFAKAMRRSTRVSS